MESEKERILFVLRCCGNCAYKNLLSKGIPSVVLRGNSICRVSPSGGIEVIARVPQSKYRIRQRSIKLPK